MKALVVHLGVARGQTPPGGLNARSAARRSLEALEPAAATLGVKIALEVLPNEISAAGSLVHFIEHDLEAHDVGICLDFGHAHLDGDVVDAVETVSEHLLATHVHDNRGRSDDHLVPFDGTIDWPAALTSIQKIGFDGTLLLELAAPASPRATLEKAKQARERMEKLLAA